ncbi:MAG TPA: hypothetical protein VNI57_03520 [Candidatus Saccharimonadales bacterium]|nr:hypothetical protein [Candidatus Saccharimonadales bacterium]
MKRYGYLGGKLARVLVASPLALILLGAGAGQVMADHDPNIIHACVKNGSIQIVSSAADCKTGETPVSLVTEAALAAIQGTNANLEAELTSLEGLTKRLHGYTGAVISHGVTTTASGAPGHFLIRLTFCDINNVVQNTCDATVGIVLEADSLTESDKGAIITFDVTNTPDFVLISSLLTNGADDIVRIDTDYYDSNGDFFGGGSSQGPDSYWFNAYPQVSSAPGINDLTGLQIESISISIDEIQLFFNQITQSTQAFLNYRVFFGIHH